MNTKTLLLVILLLLPSFVSAKYDPTTRLRLMQEAEQEFQSGNYEEARKIYLDIWATDGDNKSNELKEKCKQCISLLEEAAIAQQYGLLSVAKEKYEKILSLNPHDPKVHELLRECGDTNTGGSNFVETTAGLNMKMVWVEGGEFKMGGTSEQGSDAEKNEKPVRRVKLDSYYIAECEITQGQWEKIMGTSIQQQASTYYGVGSDYPMYCVSWEEAQAFCRELSLMTGRKYVLPTEAQWEYAARGGKNADGTKYSGSESIDKVAWYYGNSSSSTHPVKSKRPNGLGLYDMSGNVYEWCSDWKGDYNVNDTNNPTGPSSGSYRVLRGGSWDGGARFCRVSHRGYNTPGYRSCYYGFRVAVIP